MKQVGVPCTNATPGMLGARDASIDPYNVTFYIISFYELVATMSHVKRLLDDAGCLLSTL